VAAVDIVVERLRAMRSKYIKNATIAEIYGKISSPKPSLHIDLDTTINLSYLRLTFRQLILRQDGSSGTK
jgi:hypothetical protein